MPYQRRKRTELHHRRSPVPLASLVALLLAVPTSVGAACVTPDASVTPAPQAAFLRSYRPSLAAPTGLAVGRSGEVYVADAVEGVVLVREPSGRVAARIGGLGDPISIAIGPGDRVYVGDGGSGKVTAYSPSWAKLFDLGRGSGEFLMPADLAVDAATGWVYVADAGSHLIKVYNSAGALVTSFGGGGGSGDGELHHPAGIFVDSGASRVLVSDQLNSRIQVFGLDGSFRSCFGRRGSGPGKFNRPQGIWVDASGRIYVADVFDGRVQVMDANGAPIGYVARFGVTPGAVRLPTDLAIDQSNRLLVASTNNGRLEMFGLDEFADPETFAPATAAAVPADIARGCTESVVTVAIELAGYRFDELVSSSVRANGVAAAGAPELTDHDEDSVVEVRLPFSRTALLATLPETGPGVLTLTGTVAGLAFEAHETVQVAPVPDSDADGVCDERDACPATAPSDPVDGSGCAVAQICPCAQAAPQTPWPRRRAYVSCVRRAALALADAGVISEPAIDSYVAEARAATCGGLCPDRVLADMASVWGCVDQLCPCRGPGPGRVWQDHSSYVGCVRLRARKARREGLIVRTQKRAIVVEAKRSTCGRKRR